MASLLKFLLVHPTATNCKSSTYVNYILNISINFGFANLLQIVFLKQRFPTFRVMLMSVGPSNQLYDLY